MYRVALLCEFVHVACKLISPQCSLLCVFSGILVAIPEAGYDRLQNCAAFRPRARVSSVANMVVIIDPILKESRSAKLSR